MVQLARGFARRNKGDAFWGIFEIVAFISFFALGFFLNWKFMLFFLPFYYFGHCLSYLNGYYLHYGGDTDQPIAVVAGQVGYGSEYSFSRAFTRFHGQPPGRYRRQSRLPQSVSDEGGRRR